MKIKELIENSIDLDCLFSSDFTFIEMSPKWQMLFLGLPLKKFIHLVHPDDEMILSNYLEDLRAFSQKLRKLEKENCEIRLKISVDQFSWFQFQGTYLKSDDTFFCRLTQTHFKEIESQLSNPVEHSSRIGTWEIDLLNNSLYWSERTHIIHETDFKTYHPKLEDGLKFFPEEVKEDLLRNVNLLMTKGLAYDLEIPFITFKGNHLWVRTTARAMIRNNKVYRVFGTFEDITEKRKDRNRLELVLKNSQFGIWDWEIETNKVYFNEQWCHMLGLDFKNVVHELSTWDALVHPDDKLNAYLDIQTHLEGKTDYYRNVHRMKHSKGHWVWILDQGKITEFSNGKAVRFSGTHTDISYIKELEAATHTLTDRFKLILEAVKFGVWDWNIESNILKWDDSMYELFGVKRESFSGDFEAWEKTVHPEDIVRSKNELTDTIENGVDFDTSFRIIKPSGNIYHIAAKAFVERNSLGKALRITGINWDITKMIQEEKRFETILQNIPLMVTFYDQSGKIEWINPHWTSVIGYTLEEIQTIDDISQLLFVSQKEKAEVVKFMLEAPHEWKEFRVVCKNKKIIHTSWINVKLPDGRSIGIGQDINEKVQNELIIKDQQAKIIATSKLSSLGEMASGIAHEINNPLAIIQGKAAQILRRVRSDDMEKDYLIKEISKIESNTQRINKIIKGLRTFSRQGESDPIQEFTFKSLLDDVLELCSERFKYHGVELKILGDLFIKLYGQPTQLAQVLLNLINNAHDAVIELPEKWISVEISQDNESTYIKVLDSGKGIPADVAEKIMQPFFTTKEVGLGTGLGLSISKGIIDSHKGRLYLDADSPSTCFIIQLPKSH